MPAVAERIDVHDCSGEKGYPTQRSTILPTEGTAALRLWNRSPVPGRPSVGA